MSNSRVKEEREEYLVPNKKMVTWCKNTALELVNAIICWTSPDTEEWKKATHLRLKICTKTKTPDFSGESNDLPSKIVYDIATKQNIHPQAINIIGLGNCKVWQHYLRLIIDTVMNHVYDLHQSYKDWTDKEKESVFSSVKEKTGLPEYEVLNVIRKCQEWFTTFEYAKQFLDSGGDVEKIVKTLAYRCEFCGREFKVQQGLAGHLKGHKQDKEKESEKNQKQTKKRKNNQENLQSDAKRQKK